MTNRKIILLNIYSKTGTNVFVCSGEVGVDANVRCCKAETLWLQRENIGIGLDFRIKILFDLHDQCSEGSEH